MAVLFHGKIAYTLDHSLGGLFVSGLKMAACGLNCNKCNLCNAEHDLKAAESLVAWFKSRGWIEQNENAEAVMKKAPFCRGCWDKTDVRWSPDCDLLLCCEEKKLNHCGECAEFPCEKYKEWAKDLDHHKKAMEYLLSLKTNL
jgi:hypothetical protein